MIDNVDGRVDCVEEMWRGLEEMAHMLKLRIDDIEESLLTRLQALEPEILFYALDNGHDDHIRNHENAITVRTMATPEALMQVF